MADTVADMGAEGFHFAALFESEEAAAASAGDDYDGDESGEAAEQLSLNPS